MSVFYPQVTHNIGGNTSGTTANVFGNTLFLAGGNNITLSQDVNTITISAAAGGGTGGDAIRGIAAGGSTQTTNTVNLSNSNGFSFGFSSTNITASHNALTSQSTQYLAVQLGGNTAGTTSFNASNNASLILHGGNNITLSGNGSSITISAGASGSGGDAIRGIAAGGSTQTTDTVNFSNSNGMSFGFTSTDLTASHNAITSQSTQYLAIELGGNTAGTTSFNASNNASIFLHGGNNITLSGNGSSITISGGAGGGGAPIIYQYPPEFFFNNSYNFYAADTGSVSGDSSSFSYTMTGFMQYRPQIADLAFNEIALPRSISFGVSSGVGSDTNNLMVGLYTLNNSTMSLVSSFNFGILHSQSSSSAQTFHWWWGNNSNANSFSAAGNIRALFSVIRNLILWTGTGATLTSNNYYLAHIYYRSTSGANLFNFDDYIGERILYARDFNNSVIFMNELNGLFTSTNTATKVDNAFVMPASFESSIVTTSGDGYTLHKNQYLNFYSKY